MSISRVALIVSTLDIGPGRIMSLLARRLAERGTDTLLVATHGPRDSQLAREARAAGATVKHLGMGALWEVSALGRLRALLRQFRPQVVHTRTIRADLLGRVAAADGISVVTNIVNLYPEDCIVRLGPVTGRAVMALARATNRATRLFVANAQAVAENTQVAFGVPPERIRVIYDGLPLDDWGDAVHADLSSLGIAPNDFVCLTVAKLHPQKGLSDLVTAAHEVLASHPDTRFLIAGEGPDRAKLERRIAKNGLRERVLLLGNREDVPALMAAADLFVLPSRFEGLPSAIIEAMAAGRAVVATETAGTPELVEHGVTGWLVPPACPQALARTILDARSGDREKLGRAGRRKAEETFSVEAMTRGFEETYEMAAGW
jgi:glycosyltransferase involved in cell wall biosynthesis